MFIQVALLFTSCGGQRRVRILNLALKCCSQIADLFRHCELDTMINYLSKAGGYLCLDYSYTISMCVVLSKFMS